MTISKSLISQVLANCDISDAHHAGLYSICGLALRLRDLYKWELGLSPWQENDPKEVLAWIGAKEDCWETIEQEDYGRLLIHAEQYDPFDTLKINQELAPDNIFYGAGYARSLKPTFFLAPIESIEELDGVKIYSLKRELARDLLTLPALAQDDAVVLRLEAAKLYLWDQMIYLKKSGRPALNTALNAAGISSSNPQTIQQHFDEIFNIFKSTYIHHELGEIKEQNFDRTIWRDLVSQFAHSPVELLARATKDLLADTHESGALTHMIRNQDTAALGFYVAFFDGLGKEIFPQLRDAFHNFSKNINWSIMEQVSADGREIALRLARNMTAIYLEGKSKEDLKWVAKEIDQAILAPLLRSKSRIQ
jgi:hypothetical protein